MSAVAMEQRNKIHPHKFTLWVGIGSILMMFAGLTSAYIVKRSQAGWESFNLPIVFWYSTAVILFSSMSIWLAQKAFKARLMLRYRTLMAVTFFLGVLFIILQLIGFIQMLNMGHSVKSNVSYSFLWVIVGLHAAHVLGGVIVLLVMMLKAFGKKIRNYSLVPMELTSTYWHFVDALWIYLFLFLLMIK